jgi:subtilisin family serine protease
MQHPDLINNFYINPGEIAGNGIDVDGNGYTDDVTGFDFGELDNNPDDDEGHGTHVAGTIAAVGNNGIGIAGIAWNSSILPLKIADRFGRLSTAAIVGAHDYARNLILSGVNLAATNNSYGLIAGDFYEDQPTGFNAERDAIQRYIDAGGIFVAAAGNNAIDNDLPNARSYPASYNIPGVISVAATDSNDGLANFSNFGVSTVDIAAPGVNILSTLPTEAGGPYGLLSGTSMASPTVAGVVALIRSVKPTASAVEVRELLINSSDLLPSLQGKVRSGGRVNVARALAQLNVEGPVVRTFDPGPDHG